MTILHGTLDRVFGSLARQSDYYFMLAHVSMEGRSGSIDHRLCDHIGPSAPRVLRDAVRSHDDAVWVRARLPEVFGIAPEPIDEIDKALLLQVGLIAATEDREFGYPFFCTDSYGRSALMFGDAMPESIKADIAGSFWDLLLSDPMALANFECRVYNPSVARSLTYGCHRGRIYCEA